MTTERLKELFIQNNINAEGKSNYHFFRATGLSFLPLEEAWEIYLAKVDLIKSRWLKIERFEAFLRSQNVEEKQSKISESRYYNYNGVTYRFSSHVYPTGSMTNLDFGKVDLCADPHLIDNVQF
jgi:hypothetical protein